MHKRLVYLDNNAATRTDPRVLEAMLPYFCDTFGNAASSSHAFGWAAAEAVEKGRAQVAALIGAEPGEIVFTSGATESDNLALKGIAELFADKGDHLITAATEHKAVLDSARHLERQGKRVTYLPVDRFGLIDLNALEAAITGKTVLVSIMLGNNETGVLQPVAEIGRICRARGVLFHCDATQGVGKIPVDVNAMQIDLLSFTAHKMYGPKGVGALYVRRRDPRVRLTAQMDGGGHERGFRSGTLNAPGIVGFGKAAEICRDQMTQDAERTQALRDTLQKMLLDNIAGSSLNGHPELRLPNTLNICFSGIEGEALIARLPDIAVSSGSACSSESPAPSHVLKAIGLSDQAAASSLRFGLSRFSTEEEIAYAAHKLIEAAAHLKAEKIMTTLKAV